MKRMSIVLMVVISVLATASSAYAHHSFAATYFVDQEVTVKGTITQFMYRNPHSFVKIDVKDDKGQVTSWYLEWGGGAQLAQDHVTATTLKPGDVLIVSGNPGRDASERRIRVHKIERPADGWKWEGVII